MKTNVGEFDRIARVVLGLVLVGVGVAGYADYLSLGLGIAVVAAVVGLVLIVTAATRSCPIFAVLGIDSVRGDG